MPKERIRMQVNVEQLSSVKKKISFEIPAERVQAETEKVFAEIRKRAVIPGFRKGKAPQGLIRKSYQDQVEGDVMKNLFNDTYFKYIQENSLFPVGYPVLDTDPITEGAPFKYSATIEVYPEVVVNNYEGFELVREKYAADKSAVDARINQMRENMAQLNPLAEERPAAIGDHVIIDFEGFVDGNKLDGGDATDHQLELGSNNFIPGFEEQVAGMNVGEQKRINLSFPDPYHSAELAGKPVEFAVTLKEIKVKEMPELDDAFAQEFGEFETLADLKSKVAETIEKQEKDRIEREFKDSLIKMLVDKNDFELPEAMIDRQLSSMLENTKQRLQYQRMTLEMMGLDEQSYKEQFRPVAANQVKGALLLHELAKEKGIEVAEGDIETHLRKIAEESGQDYERISKYYLQSADAKQGLEEQIREEKVVELIASKAVITEKDKKEIAESSISAA
jgi:trigger factor